MKPTLTHVQGAVVFGPVFLRRHLRHNRLRLGPARVQDCRVWDPVSLSDLEIDLGVWQ